MRQNLPFVPFYSFITSAYISNGEYDWLKQDRTIRENYEFVLDKKGPPPVSAEVSPIFAKPLSDIAAWIRENEDGWRPYHGALPNPLPTDRALEDFERRLDMRRFVLEQPDVHARGLAAVLEFLDKELSPCARAAAATGQASLVSVPAYTLLPNLRQTLDNLYHLFFWQLKNSTIGYKTGHKLAYNFGEICSYLHINVQGASIQKFTMPDDELVKNLLHQTPLLELLTSPIPIAWRKADRLAHTHVIGRTRSGKTTLLERMIHEDLRDPAEPSVVVMTPHADLIRELKSLAPPYSDRMIIIDPTDAYPPAINPFAARRKLSPNALIQTFEYVLEALGLELTSKQRSLWKAVIRMLIMLPKYKGRNATLEDIRDFMLAPEKFRGIVDQLPDPSFLIDNVYNPKSKFDGTREEIGYRLADILGDPDIRRILVAQETKIDFFEELQWKRSVILIDTAKRQLADGSSLFGGLMLSLIFQAMFARDEITNEHARHPTFVYVDEAANYFGSDLSEMLTEMSKFKCGLIFAHHELQQAREKSAALAESLMSQPAIRFARPSAKDAPAVARQMATDEHWLTHLGTHHFGHFIDGLTPTTVDVKVEPLSLPKASFAQAEAIKWRSRDRVSLGRKPQPQPSPPPPQEEGEWE